MAENRRAPSPLAPNHDDVLQGKPQPKWWLMHALNYVVMAIFLGSVGLHVSRTSFGLRRDATSLLPMLTVWSCCMAYFFGFFGISFVDKDEDLFAGVDDAFEVLDLTVRREARPDEAGADAPREFSPGAGALPTLREETDARGGAAASATTPRALSAAAAARAAEERSPNERAEDADGLRGVRGEDRVRCAAALARAGGDAAALEVKIPVRLAGPVRVDGRETLAPLAGADDRLRERVDAGARALRLSGGATSRADAGEAAEPTYGCASVCVVCPTLAGADAAAALARGKALRNAQRPRAVIRDAQALGRCCYVTLSLLLPSDDAEAKALALAVGAAVCEAARGAYVGPAVAAPEPRAPATISVTAEATVPGPVLLKVLGCSVHDLCAAFARRELAARHHLARAGPRAGDALAPWASCHADDARRLVRAIDGAARGGGRGGGAPAVRAAVEAVNRGRDVHVAATLDGLAVDADGASPLAGLLRGDGLAPGAAAAAAVLGLELANLAASAHSRPRPGRT